MPANDKDREPRAYRRPLDQTPVNCDDTNVSSDIVLSSSAKLFIAVALVFLIGFAWWLHESKNNPHNPHFVSYGLFSNPITKELAKEQPQATTIKILIFPGEDLVAEMTKDLFAIYGFNLESVTVSNDNDYQKIIPGGKLGSGVLPVFILGNGMLVTNIHDMYSALTGLPIVNFNPNKKAPYVILYVSSICKSSQGLAESKLNNLGVKYDTIDIGTNNHDSVMIAAKLIASGHTDAIPADNSHPLPELTGPYVETNNHIETYTDAGKLFK